jgi:glycosyltransferase involved in cell wall biosynthesis
VKIAHLTSAHPRGDIRIFHKECKSLAQAGHQVFLVVADGAGNQLSDNIQVEDVGRSAGRINRILATTRRVAERALALGVETVHLHDPELLLVARRLKAAGKKVIFDAHEDLPKQLLGKHYLQPLARTALAGAARVYERLICSRLDGIVGATPAISDKFQLINPRTVTINNFPLAGELQPSDLERSFAPEIAYVGAIASIRGIRELIAAMSLTKSGVRLNLVGEFAEPGMKEHLETQPGWERVNFLGQLSREGVRSVLARSQAGLVTFLPVPNHVDAQPNKMFEYMSACVPVIASDFPLWRDIVEGNSCGLCVDPSDPKAIADAIDSLVLDQERVRKMGQRGLEAVESAYNWRNEERKLLDFYASL